MAEHTKDIGKYGQPKPYSGPMGNNGYPNTVANTQTQKMRGTGAATKGTGHSKKMG
jgi:hypothetical protein